MMMMLMASPGISLEHELGQCPGNVAEAQHVDSVTTTGCFSQSSDDEICGPATFWVAKNISGCAQRSYMCMVVLGCAHVCQTSGSLAWLCVVR